MGAILKLAQGKKMVRQILTPGMALLLSLLAASALRADVTSAEVNAAIARGVAYLEKQQKPGGQWTEYATEPDGGQTALITMALLSSGRTTADPSVKKALDYLEKLRDPEKTYSASLVIMAFTPADPKKH